MDIAGTTIIKRLVNSKFRRSSVIIASVVIFAGCAPSVEIGGKFEKHKIDLAVHNLHDLGVVDVNADQLLDIFTVNHSTKQSLTLNQGSMIFKDFLSPWGLDQDARFPGMALIPVDLPVAEPGLYTYWRGTELVIRSHQLTGTAPQVSGAIELLTPIKLKDTEGFVVKIDTQTLPGGETRTLIHFSGNSNGHFSLMPIQDAIPINFHLDQRHDIKSIYVGTHHISPTTTDFTIHMRDRHAMAWADYNDDMQTDVFIARGALSGKLKSIPLNLWDELYIQQENRMTDISESILPDKRGCPARQSQWVDFDRDGRLDLFIVCGRGKFPNQLLNQSDEGIFTDVANQVGLGIASEGKFVWLDNDADGDPDLVWVDNFGIYIYQNQDGHFQMQQLTRFQKDPAVTGLRIGDMDSDGDADIFLESPSKNYLLVADDGTYTVVDAAKLGLPGHSLATSWVDVDNDGIQELFSIPGGIYQRTTDKTYIATGALRWECQSLCPYRLNDALTSWVDLNNDGTRDLIMATNLSIKKKRWAPWILKLLGDTHTPSHIGPRGGQWVVDIFVNSNHQNHWLQVNLMGPPGNRQGLGARVTAYAGSIVQTQEMGHAEGARYSQGHYRVYFGLGQHNQLDLLSVVWPDGTLQTISHPLVDSLITVNWADHEAK